MNTRERTKNIWREYMKACTPKLTPRMAFEIRWQKELLEAEKRMAWVKRNLKGPYKAGEPFNYIDRIKQPQFAITKAGRGRRAYRSGWRR